MRFLVLREKIKFQDIFGTNFASSLTQPYSVKTSKVSINKREHPPCNAGAMQVHCRHMHFIFFSIRQLAMLISWIRLSLFSRHQCLLFPFNNYTVYLNSGVNQSDCYNKQLSAAELNKISHTVFLVQVTTFKHRCMLSLVFRHLAG